MTVPAYPRAVRTDRWWTDGAMVNVGETDDEGFVADAATADDAQRLVDAHNDAIREAALASSRATNETPREPGPRVEWHPNAGRSGVIVELAPIGEDGRCTGCGAQPSRETGSCRCLFAVDAALPRATSEKGRRDRP